MNLSTSCSVCSVVLKLRFLMKSVEPGEDSSSCSSSSSSTFLSSSSISPSSFPVIQWDRTKCSHQLKRSITPAGCWALGRDLILVLVWLPQTRPQAPTPNTEAHVGTAVVTHRKVFKWSLITHVMPLWIYCCVQRTLLYASRVKARLASVGSRNSTIAVSPEGGSSTRPKEPWAENSSSNSDDPTPAGRFFTRITVVLLGAAACTHPVHEETAENNWEMFFFLDDSEHSCGSHHTPGWRSPSRRCWLVETAGSPEQSASLPKPSSPQHFPLTPAKSKQAFHSVDTNVKPNYFL